MEKLLYVPPPAVGFGLLAVGYGLQRLFPGLPSIEQPVTGLVLMASGAALAASALLDFRRQGTTFVPHGEPSELVQQGPYIWTRNPMYLGLFTVLLGVAFYFGSLPMLLAPPAFYAIVSRVHIGHEEGKLAGLFGDRYERYRQRVARWI
jgi:protein-S-isoprenylcysteine O-methyltransferase Ste14